MCNSCAISSWFSPLLYNETTFDSLLSLAISREGRRKFPIFLLLLLLLFGLIIFLFISNGDVFGILLCRAVLILCTIPFMERSFMHFVWESNTDTDS